MTEWVRFRWIEPVAMKYAGATVTEETVYAQPCLHRDADEEAMDAYGDAKAWSAVAMPLRRPCLQSANRHIATPCQSSNAHTSADAPATISRQGSPQSTQCAKERVYACPSNATAVSLPRNTSCSTPTSAR